MVKRTTMSQILKEIYKDSEKKPNKQINGFVVSNESMEKFVTILSMLFLVSLVFDLAVSYTVFKYLPNVFIYSEANFIMVWGLKKSIPFFLNPTIFLNLGMLFGLNWSFKYLMKTGRGVTVFIFFTMALQFSTIGHIIGGLSWII